MGDYYGILIMINFLTKKRNKKESWLQLPDGFSYNKSQKINVYKQGGKLPGSRQTDSATSLIENRD